MKLEGSGVSRLSINSFEYPESETFSVPLLVVKVIVLVTYMSVMLIGSSASVCVKLVVAEEVVPVVVRVGLATQPVALPL